MCIWVYNVCVYVQVYREVEEGIKSPGVGIIGSFKQHSVYDWNWTLVLWKKSRRS